MDPEFSRIFRVEHLGKGEAVVEIEATPGEAAALAKRYGILDVTRVRATVRLTAIARGDVAMDADFDATVVQRCVVTLDPVESRLQGSFSLVYLENASDGDEGLADVIDGNDPDPAEPIVDGQIDVGEAVAEQIALEIDPFPRAPGAEFTLPAAAGGAESVGDERPNPFAKLAILKDKLEQGD